jgi:hypothetical protein
MLIVLKIIVFPCHRLFAVGKHCNKGIELHTNDVMALLLKSNTRKEERFIIGLHSHVSIVVKDCKK